MSVESLLLSELEHEETQVQFSISMDHMDGTPSSEIPAALLPFAHYLPSSLVNTPFCRPRANF